MNGKRTTGVLWYALLLIAVLVGTNCTQAETQRTAKAASAVSVIENTAQFNALLDTSANRLLVFDLYADWCGPCRMLSPVLEKIAADSKGAARFYKINVDRNPELASRFQVSGIPYVVMLKNKKVVQAFTGVQPEAAYRRAVAAHGESVEAASRPDQPDGELADGVRVIRLGTATTVGNLYVYRGEEVRLVFEKVEFPFSVHIPAFNASASAAKGETLTLEFKAKEAGAFPMMCNGNCPVGDGQQFARVVVLEYEVDDTKAVFKSIGPKKVSDIIAAEQPVILDVRTPNEFYEGHLAGAVLMPVQQIADRIGELGAYKNKTVVVYCRSGNRSIPASQILIRNGFKKVYNMQHGILGWAREGLPVEKP